MIALLLGLAACGGSGAPTADGPPQALVLNAPVREGRPPWMLQLLVPPGETEVLAPEVLFPALVASIEPALESCGVTPADGDAFLIEGELRLEAGFPGDGSSMTLHVADAEGKPRCVVDAANSIGALGPEGVTMRLPMAIVLRPTDPDGDSDSR